MTLRAALKWCDEMIVFLHACTDESSDIVHRIAVLYRDRVTIIGDSLNPMWDEMQHRQRMLEMARQPEIGATHIAIIDADEIVVGTVLVPLPGPGQMLMLPGYNLRGGIDFYHANGIWGDRWFSMIFEDQPNLGWHGDGFHHRAPHGSESFAGRKSLDRVGRSGVLHLWGASEKRLMAKHALYKVTERLKFGNKSLDLIDREYNLWRSKSDVQRLYPTVKQFHDPWTFRPVPQNWWEDHLDVIKYLDVDREPWQIAEVQRLVKEHGAEKFAGLDLFGIV